MSKQCLHTPQFLVVQPAHLLQEANLCCFSALQTILAFFSRITWEDTSLKPTPLAACFPAPQASPWF